MYLCDHHPPGLGALPVGRSLASLGEQAFPRGPVLQAELTQDPTEPGDGHITHTVRRLAQEQQEGVEPATKSH